jgi:hypothetical protein
MIRPILSLRSYRPTGRSTNVPPNVSSKADWGRSKMIPHIAELIEAFGPRRVPLTAGNRAE